MPDLSTKLHLEMFQASRRRNAFVRRVAFALKRIREPLLYGTQWGVIDDVPPLLHTLKHWVEPYINPDHDAVEIGPGGGRWTSHLLGFSHLYAVDYHEELLSELKQGFGNHRNLTFIRNNGTDFPGIPDKSIDFCFSFGVFVHLDLPIIESYLDHLQRIVKPGGNIVLHYADKNKIMAQEQDGLSQNTPELMRAAVLKHGYEIRQEDTTSLWHSALIRFTPA